MVKRVEAFMDTNVWIIISLVLAAAVIILAAMLFTQRRRSGQLQQRFGSEYERTVSRYGSQKEAEEELIRASAVWIVLRSYRFRVKMRRGSVRIGAPCKIVLSTIRKQPSRMLTGRYAT